MLIAILNTGNPVPRIGVCRVVHGGHVPQERVEEVEEDEEDRPIRKRGSRSSG